MLETQAAFIRDLLKTGQAIESSEFINSELMRRPQRAACDVARATRRAVLDAARPASAHQGAASADRRTRSADPRRGRAAGPLARERCRALPARVESLTSGLDQLKRQAASTNEQDVQLRALEREAKAQRDLLEILSGEIPRGDGARQHRRRAGRCAHHLARARVQHAVLPEEGADRADRGARRRFC